MIRHIFKYVCIITILSCFTACSDFLDNAPDGELTIEMVFSDKTRTEDWLAAIYNKIPDGYYNSLRDHDAFGDDVSPSAGWEPYDWNCISKLNGNWTPSSKGGIDHFWNDLPKSIRSAYIFLENARALPAQQVYEQDAIIMKGEARFLIAYFYSLLVQSYGAIPLQTWLSNFDDSAEQLMIPQTPFDEAVEWIANELLEVSKILPASYTDNRKYGRATSISALAVRARLLLFAASPLTNGNPDYKGFVNSAGEEVFNSVESADKWKLAAKASLDLINEAHANGYKLYQEFNDDGSIDPFLSYSNAMYTEFHQGNKEIIFVRTQSEYGNYARHAIPFGLNGAGGLGVTQTLVDDFFMSNGLPAITGYTADDKPIINTQSGYTETGFADDDMIMKTQWIEGSQHAKKGQLENIVAPKGVFNMYYNREPRFYVSVLYNGAWLRIGNRESDFYTGGKDGIGAAGGPWDAPQNGYLLRKRVHPDTDVRANSYHPYRPSILFRLAEFYLSYAEALNETEPNNTTEILKYVNLVRERAGIPTYGTGADQIPVPSGQAAMRTAIHRERRVELNCEPFIRFNDIRRLKQMDLVKNKKFYGMNAAGTVKSDDPADPDAFFVRTHYFTRYFDDKNYWFPIPQAEIDKNPAVKQLPGW
ncbi:MAG: RagB/SusD family nutrient uptake outer membrane protein [Tannerellaceae bacterium]|nr:RagB/SusD family nutrient uptake outer membrane protein [Tannerellaceae bacterium]